MRGLSLLRFPRALLGLGMLGALLGLGAAPTPEAPPSCNPPEGVQVPVVLDGVRYEPEEFNRIEADLRRRGIALCFTFARDGTFHAFSTKEACEEFLWKEWDQPRGLPFKPIDLSPPVHPFRIRMEEREGKVFVWVEPIVEPSSSDGSDRITPPPYAQP
ncbi:MAG TPA: hypothetical protein VNK89_11565 [Thermoflexus sp.]|nr:hypothetical protein [Thermoflexus sp.]